MLLGSDTIHIKVMYTAIVFIILSLALLPCYSRKKGRASSVPTNWPVVGMAPGLLSNINRLHDYVTEFLEQSGGTFSFKGPVFANFDMLITCDPANINYVLIKNFPNFGKGPAFKKMFQELGDGIFIAETESWENQRRITKSVMSHVRFQEFVATSTWRKMETGLMPILQSVCEQGMDIDLQELFQRFAFDCTCITVLGHDPASLCEELPHLPYEKGFAYAEEAVLYRHLFPDAVWKTQKWLGIGIEKKWSEANENIRTFLSDCISLKLGNIKPVDAFARRGNDDLDVLTSCIKVLGEKGDTTNVPENFLFDLMLSLVFAGKDTISATLCWLFWLLATNPEEEKKIRNEIITNSEELGNWKFSNMDALNGLIYLHAAVCETLRLFPPIPFQHKAPIKHDILPSGHRIKANTRTLLPFYSMGRMESIWGKDCLQFKPGRWISDRGSVKVEPSYKFAAFNAGPRSCLGKGISFIQVKIVAAAILSRFRIAVAEDHPVQPSLSIVLHMKHGLKVKVSSTHVQ